MPGFSRSAETVCRRACPAGPVRLQQDSVRYNMTNKTIGIIGDGQLGMLLCEAAPALGLETVMLTGDPHCAAAQRASRAIEGGMDSEAAITALIDSCDVITYEREDVPPGSLALLKDAESQGRVSCYPPLWNIELLQDKAAQKIWLAEQGLATLPFVISDGSAGKPDEAVEALGYPLVQKALRGGFDGRGVQLLRSPDDLAKSWPGSTLFERYAGSFREIAVLVVRERDGNCQHFGPVDMRFETEHSVLDTVSAPAALSAELEASAVDLALRAVTALEGVGVYGVEMFLLEDHEVLINEIAPRVHNSGHYSIDACTSSQFEQHLRAVAGLPLGSTELLRPAAMRNLLCTPALQTQGLTHAAGTVAGADGATIYWYGKSPARLMRKLGHITAVADSASEAVRISTVCWDAIQKEAVAQ